MQTHIGYRINTHFKDTMYRSRIVIQFRFLYKFYRETTLIDYVSYVFWVLYYFCAKKRKWKMNFTDETRNGFIRKDFFITQNCSSSKL